MPLASLPAKIGEPSNSDFMKHCDVAMVYDAEEMDITEWLQTDENDHGFIHLIDQEIVEYSMIYSYIISM